MNTKKALLTVCVAIVLAGCGNKETNQNEAERIEPVRTEALQKQEIARNIEFSTTLQGYETVNIAPAMSGKIEHIYVEVGTYVSEGQLLVRMDQNQLNTAKLTFTNLTNELQRMEALRAGGSVSQQNYDQLKLQHDQAQESLAFLQRNTFVTAPIAGVVAAKTYEDGELFAGQPIVVLTQINRLKALVNIPETYFPLVKEGMQLTLTSDIYPDRIFNAEIEIVYPTIDASSHTFQAKLKIPNGKQDLRPGMFVRTTLALGKTITMIVPYQAVLKQQGTNDRYVFINDNGIAKRVAVTLGTRFDDKTEIISGSLKAGDELVVVGQSRLIPGVKLSIVPQGQEIK
ncbi:MAG: efflux RND transporter periplasmic adaptor subunit [Prevotellaceae bacterium]|jgi:RND family efflux transporter MFP subunit|nr:efflux RND transporter periplasmic adaptor subunit [Prevotellaceae bacterium]